MLRIPALLAVIFITPVASAADLPPGALVRLGDDRFRAGREVQHLALSPDGKQFATVTDRGNFCELAVWDALTGRPIRAQRLNSNLFKGMAWGTAGGFALVERADRSGQYPDDFRVWKFSDPKAEPPPELPVRWTSLGYRVDVPRPTSANEYTALHLPADGRRVAAVLKTAKGKYAVHVFDLKPADTVADLVRVAALDLGAEECAARLSPDGKSIVTFRIIRGPDGWECIATPWALATGTSRTTVRVADRYVGAHQTQYERLPPVTPDGRSLVVYYRKSQNEGYRLLDLDSGKPSEFIRWQPGDRKFAEGQLLGECAFFPSGRVFMDAWTAHPTLIDTATGKELGRLTGHASAPTAVAVSADETRIATADAHGLIRLWDAGSFRPVADTPGHRAPVESARLSPDGKRLLTGASDGTVRLWDLATGKNERTFTDASEVAAEGALAGVFDASDQPTFTPDGAAVVYCTKKRLIVRDVRTGSEVPLPGAMARLGPRGAVFAPDGKAVLTWANPNSEKDKIEVWDWPEGKKRFAWNPDRGFSPRFSADGAAVFEDSESPNRRDARTGKELPPAWAGAASYCELASLRDSPRLLIRSADPEGEVTDADTGKRILRLDLRPYRTWPSAFKQIALSPTRFVFARQSEDETDTVNLREIATGEIRQALAGHRGEVRVLGFTPDGTKLLTAGSDHTILVWDVRLQAAPLPDAIRKETDPAKLWGMLASGVTKDAYHAMARLAREPDATLKVARQYLKPAAKGVSEVGVTDVTDARAIELLEALGRGESLELLKELAAGEPSAFRTQEAKRALERRGKR